MRQELIAVGHIGRAVGLKGFVAVYPTGTTFNTLKPPVSVYVGHREQQVEKIEIELIKEQPKCLVVQFSGILDRDAAGELNGKNVYVNKERLPILQEGEFYHFQLEGLKVFVDKKNRCLGEVVDVLSLPTTDALEVKLENGNTVLIPYNDQAVVSVDPQLGRVTVKGPFIEEML